MRLIRALLISSTVAPGLAAAAQPPEDNKGEKERAAWEEKLRKLEPMRASDLIRVAANGRLVALLGKAERMELYRLNPHKSVGKAPAEGFHGYGVLARVPVARAEDRAELVSSLGREFHWLEELLLALCFSPRHGLRAVVGEDVVDLVICFECGLMDVYRNGTPTEGIPLVGRKWEPAEKLLRAVEGTKQR